MSTKENSGHYRQTGDNEHETPICTPVGAHYGVCFLALTAYEPPLLLWEFILVDYVISNALTVILSSLSERLLQVKVCFRY
jgi:hypothetical protein